jgi:predicted MPP superfamily phosphohydrolase
MEIASAAAFIAFVVVIYLLEIRLILDFLLSKVRNAKRRFNLPGAFEVAVHILAVVGVACFLYGWFVEPYRVEVSNINISTGKLHNTSLRIVQISDLHCDNKVVNENKLAGLINPLNPDIIVFTGDLLNTPEGLPECKSALAGLKAQIGKYAVYGNFDEWFSKSLDLFSGTGFEILNGKSLALSKDGETFIISGLNYDDPEKWRDVLQDVPPGHYSIFLYHTPDLIEDIQGQNVDLYLAGHTHGGQVQLPFYGALITLSKYGKKYEAGRYTVGTTTLYVNRGLGMENFPAPRVRFLARPEITVFDVTPAH